MTIKIKKELQTFYDAEAEKYYYTRNKHRSDGYIILNEIKNYIHTENKNTISILEFWCGWWRLIKFLNKEIKDKKLNIKINYIWVDLSQKLLNFAQKDNKENKFICQDISKYIKHTKQESLDFIIWIASFQHIPNQTERLYLTNAFYKALKYNWKLIMLNRSFSSRFIKKFKKTIRQSIIKTIYTLWLHNWRDLDIPRQSKDKNKTLHKRFYHMFWKNELSNIWKLSSFKITTLTYIDKTWQETANRKKSNNTLFIWEKKIF